MSQAVIGGVAESQLGVTQRNILDLQTEAIMAALDDAGIPLSEVDGLATVGITGRFDAVTVCDYLRISPRWLDEVHLGGASFLPLVARAVDAVNAGHCDVAVVSYANNQRSAQSRSIGGGLVSGIPITEFESPYGPLLPISAYALAASRYEYEFGTGVEDLAPIPIAAREWALLNPAAYRHGSGPLTLEDIRDSPMVSSPLRRADCCLLTDGGGAVVIAKRSRFDRPERCVQVLGDGLRASHRSLTEMPDLAYEAARDSGRAAMRSAGVELDDIDVLQLYDSFTITVALTIEALGLCDRGQAAQFVADVGIGPKGNRPLNTSGGGLSYCHPGMFGIFLIIEAVRQLRGECGARQQSSHDLALCHGTGGYLNAHTTLVLGR